MIKFKDNNNSGAMITIGTLYDPDESLLYDDEDLPILPARNLVLFPEVTIPIHLVRESACAVAHAAKKNHKVIGVVCQLNADDDNPSIDTINKYGVLATIIDVVKMPDGTQTAIVRAAGKFKILGRGQGVAMPEATISAKVKPIIEVQPKNSDNEFVALCEAINSAINRMRQQAAEGQHIHDMFMNMVQESSDSVDRINIIATHINFDIAFKMKMLAMYRIKERAIALYEEIVRHEEMMRITESVNQRARESFDEQQRRVFIQRQMEAIDQ